MGSEWEARKKGEEGLTMCVGACRSFEIRELFQGAEREGWCLGFITVGERGPRTVDKCSHGGVRRWRKGEGKGGKESQK